MRRIVIVATSFALLYGCLGPVHGEISVPKLDRTVEASLAFPAGQSLSFAVHADKVEYRGGNTILLDVRLMRAGKEVGVMQCEGFEVDGGSGCESGATHLNSGCALVVPEGGSDAMRVRATLMYAGDFEVEGLAIYLRD